MMKASFALFSALFAAACAHDAPEAEAAAPPRVATSFYPLTYFVETIAGNELASEMGIADLLTRKPKKLSQGERQRVALCRALVTQPKLLMCDEPTGNLDPKNAATIVELLLRQAREHAATVFMVTHDHGLLKRFDRVVDVRNLNGRGA